MKIAEIFYSVQGEGSLIGAPSVFIRTSGCNLRCSWCDTPYASWSPEGLDLSLSEILAQVAAFRAPYAVVTGGEPMIAPGIVDLTTQLRALGLHVTIETAGTVWQPVACDLMSISPKLGNSTPDGHFRLQHERLRLQSDILAKLIRAYPYQLKFVIANPGDLDEVRALVATLDADPRHVILMPEGIHPDDLRQRGQWVAELCKQSGYRFSPRLHVDLWGNRRGI